MYRNSTIRSFLNFIIKPDYYRFENLTISQKLKELLKLYLITIIIAAIINLINKLFIHIGLYNEYSQHISNLPELSNVNFIKWYLIFGLFCPPFLEEISFRLLLTKFYKKYVYISISLIIGILLYKLFHKHLWHSHYSILINIISYLYPIIFATPIYLGLSLIKYDIANMWNNNFAFIFYLFTIFFALIHIPTLNIKLEHYYYLPVIILPFILYGISLGYTRIRLGILYSIALHFILNAPIILISLMKI